MSELEEYKRLIKAQKQYREDSMSSFCDEVGRSLHAEFEDFYETKDMPMCDMLGEIYKEKLLQIAKILEKHNINV